MTKNLSCVILAGGLGLRLRSVVKDVPKPMANVQNRPFLEYLLFQLRKSGLNDIVLCVGYKAEVIENYFADGRNFGVKIQYCREEKVLGTAGALANAKTLINSDPFILMNGDSFCEVDLEELIKQHQLSKAIATIVTLWANDRSQYASIEFNKEAAITGFREKQGQDTSGYINGGIYVLSKEILALIPASNFCSIEQDIFLNLVGQGLYAFKASGLFIDIGTPLDLQRAQDIFKNYTIDKYK